MRDKVNWQLRALIVEDSEDDTKLLVRRLTKEGFAVASHRVDTAAAMRAALDAGPWDVVIADDTMPEFSALAALETLKNSGLDLPFIIVSGLIGEDVAVAAMKAGAHDFLMKGSLARLAPAIRRELRDAIVRRQNREADAALSMAHTMPMQLHVLIVEDSEDDTKLLVRRLTKEGFAVAWRRVETAANMRAALDAGPWDVVIADHSMPEFSALAALETLKNSGLDLPFIIVSGLIGEDVAVAAMKAGAHDYLTKGSLARLAPAVRRELREATVRRQHREANAALRVAYAELETRVAERTAELACTNEELVTANEALACANEELARTNDELRLRKEHEIAALEELDRQKDEFLSIAAHELKTPVTTLQGFAQVMLRLHEKHGAIEPERLERGLQTIVRQAQKLAALVAQLLDVSRIEGGRLALECRSVDLAHLVTDVATSVQMGHPQHPITVEAPPRAEACVDPLRIEQVITNLVNNAVQHSPDGPIEITLAAADGKFELAVRDHGIGIPPEHLPHIFERFYQVKNSQHTTGMGLGLYISSQIVSMHGGHIQVECPPDGGSRFTVVLPAGTCD